MSTESDEIDLSSLENGLHSLFRYLFINNCHLNKASVTEEELSTLEELEPLEVLENFKDLTMELLKFKQDHIASDMAELSEKAVQFENMLQKLEAEVREHISIEHQLRLHNENTQGKLEEAETALERQKKELSQLQGKLDSTSVVNKKHFESKLQSQIEKVSKRHRENSARHDTQNRLHMELQKQRARVLKLEEENINLKTQVEVKQREIEMLKGNYSKIKAYDAPKRKEKTIDTARRPKTAKKQGKKTSSSHLRNSPAPPVKKNPYASKQHIRSFSDYAKPVQNKRAPSR